MVAWFVVGNRVAMHFSSEVNSNNFYVSRVVRLIDHERYSVPVNAVHAITHTPQLTHEHSTESEGHCYKYGNIQRSGPPSSPHLTPRDCQQTFLIWKTGSLRNGIKYQGNTDKGLGRNELSNVRPVCAVQPLHGLKGGFGGSLYAAPKLKF